MDPIEAEVPTPDVEAPVADQPVADSTEAEAPEGTTEATEQTPTEPEAPEPEASEDEQFTDLDVSDLPEEVQDRHREMQADYTRKTQALAERHQELDHAVSFVTDLVADEPNETQEAVFRTLAERLGYEIDGGEADPTATEDPEETPTDERTDRERYVDDLIARDEAEAQTKAEQERETHLDEVESTISDGITALGKADGVELTEAEIDLIFDGVLALPAVDGGPNVQAAYERYKAATKAHTDRWVKSKKSTTAPGGAEASEAVDFTNEEERLAFTARAVQAAQRAQSGL